MTGDLRQLPPLPPTVRLPTEADLQFAHTLSLNEVQLYWSEDRCRLCRGTKRFRMWAGVPLQSEVVEWECPCVEEMILDRYLSVRGVTIHMRQLGLLDAIGLPRTAREWVADWATHADAYIRHGRGAIFRGSNGSGKTMLASLIQKRLLSTGVECYSVRAQSIGVTADWRRDETKEWWRRKVRGAKVLVIDELGVEKGNEDYNETRLDDLFAYRESNLLPTIVTTNKSVDHLRSKYGSDLLAVSPVVEISSEAAFDRQAVLDAEIKHDISRPSVLLSHVS